MDKLEVVVERTLNELKIKYQKIPNKSKWRPGKSVYDLENKLIIETFQGNDNGIRLKHIEPVNNEFVEIIRDPLKRYRIAKFDKITITPFRAILPDP